MRIIPKNIVILSVFLGTIFGLMISFTILFLDPLYYIDSILLITKFVFIGGLFGFLISFPIKKFRYLGLVPIIFFIIGIIFSIIIYKLITPYCPPCPHNGIEIVTCAPNWI